MNETRARDYRAGALDAQAGFYDKWYRYNRNDDGAAYDAGIRSVTHDGLTIIETISALA